MADKIKPTEQTLDPQDWDSMRQLGHEMVDDMFEYLKTIGDYPIWKKPSESSKTALTVAIPQAGESPESVYHQFKENILPFAMGNIHPRFWGWVNGTGTPLTMLAEMLAAGMNPNCGVGDHAANYLELQVLDWCKEMLGYPKQASGLLVSGGSMANMLSLAVARNSIDGLNVRNDGVANAKLRIYYSTETHNSVQKTIELLGLGAASIRKISADQHFKMKTDELAAAIATDLNDGLLPFCVIGNVGTVNTGAIDDLQQISAICKKHNLWFHVDGAFGAITNILPEFHDKLAGMEQADSLAFDLHKWLYIPYEAGCFLIKDPKKHEAAFAVVPDYLMHHERGLAGGPNPPGNLGIELSRGFKALKVWFSLKEHGVEKYRTLVRQNIAQAGYLASLVEKTSELELMAPAPMNIVCYRFKKAGLKQDVLNELNKEILMELHEQGIAVPTFTLIDKKYVIRVAITNHRSRREDFDVLVQETLRLGNELIRRFQ